MPDQITVSEFVAETHEDYKAPTASSFTTRTAQCRNTVAAIEEVSGGGRRRGRAARASGGVAPCPPPPPLPLAPAPGEKFLFLHSGRGRAAPARHRSPLFRVGGSEDMADGYLGPF